MRNHLFVGAAVAALMVPASAYAQQITTGIEGAVTDDSGAPVAGATVTITDTRTGATRTITTSSSGTFGATGLVTGGPYTVTANAPGYEGQTVENIVTTLQGNTSLSFQLSSGAGEIVVTAARANVTQLEVGPGQSFGVEVLENAPSFNRDVRDIIRIDPRVSLDRDDTGSGQDRISCLGGNDRGNAFTVDGISQGDVYGLNDTGFSSRSSTPIPYDAVRETQVAFAPFDVDYGNFTGCAINVVTRSGTNDYHFGGFFEYTDDGLRGNTLDDRGESLAVPPVKPEKRWGAYLGGPVIKDKLFLFGAYEHQEAAFSQDVGAAGGGFPFEISQVTVDQFNEVSDVLSSVYGVETGPLVLTRPFENDRYFVRADWQINDKHRFEATYQRLVEASTKEDDQANTGSFSGTVVGENTFFLSGTKSNYYSGRLYSQWNDNFSTELRYSRSEVQDRQDPIGGGEAQSDNPIPRIVVGIPNGAGAADDGAVEAGPGFSRSANDLRTNIDQYRVAAVLEAGDHRFKVGAELNHADLFNLFVQNATGTLVFRNIDDLRNGILSNGSDTFNTPTNVVNGTTAGAFGNFSATGDVNDAAAAFTRNIYSVFAQDDWQATERLGVTAGVRVDWYDGGHPRLNPNFVARYGFGNDSGFSALDPIVMPRLAATYDFDDFAVFSRAQLRGGVGIFSGGDPLVWFGNAFQNDGRGFAEGTSDDSACPAGPLDVVVNGQFTGVPTCIQASGVAGAAAGTGDTQSIDPNITQPSVVRANLGFSTDLNFAPSGFFSGWHVNLDYIYSHYRDPLTIVDLSQTPDPSKGLSGFTVDGRPIYAAIDPTNVGCNAVLATTSFVPPLYTGVTQQCFFETDANGNILLDSRGRMVREGRDDELMLTNAGSFDSHVASFLLSKQFRSGVFTEGGSIDFSVGYAYTNAHDRRNMFNSTAGSNYDRTAAFDRQNPAESRGFYSSKHNIVVRTAFREEFFDDLDTRLGITFVARAGRPYSLTFRSGGVFNDSSSGSDNALVYLPTGVNDPNISPSSNMAKVQELVDWASGYGCAKDYLGQSVPRNTCSGSWYYDMDVSISQEIPGPGRLFGRDDKIKLYATMDNFLNFLDSGWNLQRRRDFSGLQDVASTSGVDAQGRYIITGFNGAQAIAEDNFINISSSVWRLKVGVSYDF